MIENRTVVEDINSGQRGVVIDDPFNLAEGHGVQVVWEGETLELGSFTPEAKLKILGPENAVVSVHECKRGGGADACIFWSCDGKGEHCERFGPLRFALMAHKTMKAKFNPTKLYPDCKTEPARG